MPSPRSLSIAALLTLVIAAPVHAESNPDPFERLNRGMFAFNDAIDRGALKPLARGYNFIVPKFLRAGISNVLSNVGTPLVAVNQLLQGKPGLAGQDLGRFVINTTLGMGGLLDPATPSGLPAHTEDFGQTLRVWGVPAGPYLVAPFMGGSTATAGFGNIVSGFVSPIRLLQNNDQRISAIALTVVDARARLLQVETLVSGDRYLFIRDAYLQRREFLVNDGKMEADPFLDEFDEDEEW
ncbi:MAG: VacJ family lipoprotein [Pseudomonadota bacterium]